LLGSLIGVLALLALAVVPVMAQLPVFSPFFGNVTIDGADAPVGSQLKAYVDGVQAELLDPAVNDVYTLTTAGEYEIVIKTGAKDQLVTFKVKKAGTTVWLDATAYPTSPVTSYEGQEVDLTAGTGGPTTFTLTIAVYPAGKGSTSPSVGTHSYSAGTSVTITAIESVSGYEFDRWSGDASGTNPTTTVTMNSDKSVTARFQSIGGEEDSFASWLYANFVESLVED
jgi:uncharacterized repeat protein (TIGR02543 family)